MQGYIKIPREVFESELWLRKPFDWARAWIDLIQLANYQPGYILARHIKIPIERGQVGWSQVELAKRWGWSRWKVQHFLDYMETEQQIKQQNNNVSSVITIINYDCDTENKQQNKQQTSSKQALSNKEKKERIYTAPEKMKKSSLGNCTVCGTEWVPDRSGGLANFCQRHEGICKDCCTCYKVKEISPAYKKAAAKSL